jgi:hypothetical protein
VQERSKPGIEASGAPPQRAAFRPSALSEGRRPAAGVGSGPVLLAMQRQAGNVATAAMVGRMGPAPRGQAPLAGAGAGMGVQRTPAQEARQACDHYRTMYSAVFEALDSIRLSPTALQIRLGDLVKVAGQGTLEDYTDEVLGNDDVKRSLVSIAKKTKATESSRVVAMVNDALLFTSLVPAQEERHRQKRTFGATAVYDRRAVEVMSLDRLIALLQDVSLAAGLKGDVFTDADSVKGIRYKKADTLAARMATLSLVNMKQAARQGLQDDPFFQALLKSPALGDFMMASSGADEQVFLNTCATSAVSQQVLGQVTTLAGLLLVGRNIADRVEAQAQGEGANLDQTERKRFKEKRTIRDLATTRVAEARAEFRAVQTEAQDIATSGRHDVGALKALTKRWSRQVQKLAGVIDLSGGTSSVPVLSKKVVPDAWMASAALSTLSVAVPVDRTMRRGEATDQDKVLAAVGDVVQLPTTDSPNRKLKPLLTGSQADANIGTFWEKVFAGGGCMFDAPGHSLYVKAIKRGGERTFAIGDPKNSRYDYRSVASFASYARSNDIVVPATFLP